MRIIDDAGAKQALLDGAAYDVSVIVTPVGGTAVLIDGDHISQNGISINPSSVSGNKLELGSVISATADFDFFNYDGTLDGINFKGAELYVEGSVDVSGTATAFPIGYFIADTVKVSGRKIHVQAFDRMILLDQVIGEQIPVFPGLPDEMLYRSFAICPFGRWLFSWISFLVAGKSGCMKNMLNEVIFRYLNHACTESGGWTWQDLGSKYRIWQSVYWRRLESSPVSNR